MRFCKPVLVLTKFCTTYPLARIQGWTFQPLEQSFLNWPLQTCGVFLHWSFANAISSYVLHVWLNKSLNHMTVILEFLRARTTSWGVCTFASPEILGAWKHLFPVQVFMLGDGERPLQGRSWRVSRDRWGVRLGLGPSDAGGASTWVLVQLGPELWAKAGGCWEPEKGEGGRLWL